MKANIEEEIKNINYLSILNSKIENIITFTLPKENSIRNLIVIKKLSNINNLYPRNYKEIIKNSI